MPTKALLVEKETNAIFDKHRHYYDFYHKTGEIVNFHHDVQIELLNEYDWPEEIINEEVFIEEFAC